MWTLLRHNRGTSAVEFALVCLPFMVFILGVMQTAWIVWADNLLQIAADSAARCGAVKSTTSPCFGGTTANMIQTANKVFLPMTGAIFTANTSSCSTDNGTGLFGTYQINFLFVVKMTLTVKSCFPTVS